MRPGQEAAGTEARRERCEGWSAKMGDAAGPEGAGEGGEAGDGGGGEGEAVDYLGVLGGVVVGGGAAYVDRLACVARLAQPRRQELEFRERGAHEADVARLRADLHARELGGLAALARR